MLPIPDNVFKSRLDTGFVDKHGGVVSTVSSRGIPVGYRLQGRKIKILNRLEVSFIYQVLSLTLPI